MSLLIQAESISTSYGLHNNYIFKPLSFSISRGSITAIIGENGSGKSTLMKLIAGLISYHAGKLEKITNNIGFVPEKVVLPEHMTCYNFLWYHAQLVSLSGIILEERIETLLIDLNLNQVATKKIGSLSKGTVQRIAIAQALIGKPELLILDEPFSGLDQLSIELITAHCFNTSQHALIFSAHTLPITTSYKIDAVIYL